MLKRMRLVLCAAAVVVISLPAWAAEGVHQARFGGIFIESKTMDMEVVAKPDMLQLYVSDHGKPIKLDGAKAKITLVNGAEITEVDLPLAVDKFQASGTFKLVKGTKGIVLVTLAGKPGTTARFTAQ